jgi:predicted DNA-binding transcriptional regulator AlpA
MTPPPDAVDPLLRKRQVAAALAVSERKLEMMIAAGIFPGPTYYPGMDNLPRWRVSTVRGWLDRGPGPQEKGG